MASKYLRTYENCAGFANNNWYHATTLDNWHKIKEIGVKADYNKEGSSELDFGYGFYLSNKSTVAENFVLKLKKAGALLEDDILTVIEFGFSPLQWFEEVVYNTYIINEHTDEFALFVYENRLNNIVGRGQHKYDAIFGVMSDSNPTDTGKLHLMSSI